MKDSNFPLAFWGYCVEQRAHINNLTAKNIFQIHGLNPQTALTGDEGDISNLCQFKCYDWCYFRNRTEPFPFNREVLGRIIGPAKGEGNEMAQWVLKANGNVVTRRSSRPLTVIKNHSPTEIRKRGIFYELIKRRHGTSINPPKISTLTDEESDDKEFEFEAYEYDSEQARIVPDIEDTADATGKKLNQKPSYNQIIDGEVSLQMGENMTVRRVTKQAIGPDGNVAGTYEENPYLNSMIYEVKFPNGQVKEYADNIIAKNIPH